MSDPDMYQKIIRPLFFKLSPETSHKIIMGGLRVMRYIPGGKAFVRSICTFSHPSLEREVFGLKFPNPVGLAAGFDKDAAAFSELAALGFGFIEVGTITPKAQRGNPKPRLFRLTRDKAIINRMGFNNDGLENALDNLRCRCRTHGNIVGANLGKNTLTPNEDAAADYLKLFRNLYQYVDYFVVNVSCPNIAKLACLQEKNSLRELLSGLVEFRRGQNQYRPILLKISPDLTDGQIDDSIEVMAECGLDGIVATNTTVSREGLSTDRPVVEAIGKGGLSGAPLRERALEVVKYVHRKTEGRYPIIGVGGIMTVEDAKAMLDAGASLIQVYSGFIYDGPLFAKKICRYLVSHGGDATM